MQGDPAPARFFIFHDGCHMYSKSVFIAGFAAHGIVTAQKFEDAIGYISLLLLCAGYVLFHDVRYRTR